MTTTSAVRRRDSTTKGRVLHQPYIRFRLSKSSHTSACGKSSGGDLLGAKDEGPRDTKSLLVILSSVWAG